MRSPVARSRRLPVASAAIVALQLVASAAFAATWTVSASPNVTPFDNVLWGVGALAPTSAWAVGSADTGTLPTRRPVVLRWDGTRWASAANPLPPGGGELRDVDALSSTDAWAVGFTNSSIGFDTLIERWNGNAWTIVPSPNLSAQNTLIGVKAFSANDAWAVGSNNVPGTLNFATLIERWDGTRWSVVPSPSPDPFENRLVDVDGVAPNDVWAVGSRQNAPDGVHQALVLHFDGTAWSTVPVPTGIDATLEAVVAAASNDVWAVGSEFSLSVFWHVPLALHWDGHTWTRSPIPSPGPQGGRLFGVAATSSTGVYAVGQTGGAGGLPSLIMRWNGVGWTTEATPRRTTVAALWAASGVSPGTVFAVGSGAQLRRGVLTPSRTLVLRSGNA